MNGIFKLATSAAGAALALSATASPAQAQWHSGYRHHGGGYQNAVNACIHRADRQSRGKVRVLDVDRRGDNRFRVRGVIERAYGHGHRGRASFTCTARGNGRITNFDIDRHRR